MTNRVEPANFSNSPVPSLKNGETNISGSSTSLKHGEQGNESGETGRIKWAGQVEFILTLVGYAVGLGNIWRFPYLCFKNGGGAFLIPYFLTLALIGLPLFYLEISFGQFASLGPIKIWAISPLFKGLGVAIVVTNTLVGIYYNVILSWIIYFLFASMTSELPWATCGHSWNTDKCVVTTEMKNIVNGTHTVNNVTYAKTNLTSPSEEYYYRQVLKISDGIGDVGTVQWDLALCLLLAWLVIFFVLIKGISSLGKVVYFTTLFPYVLLTVMVIRGCTLEGALDGIIYYLNPDFSRLTDARVWSDAATQIFFSLGVAAGALIAMASYNEFHNNCYRDAVMVPIINCATSFYGGFATFSILGYMALQKGVGVEDVAASGPGLVFVVYPEALSTMPVAPLWSILFFLMMLTLGFSTMFSIIETFFCAMMDEFPSVLAKTRWHQIAFRAVGCSCFYLIGLSMVTNGGFYVFSVIDVYLAGFPLLFNGFIEYSVIVYIYGFTRFADDIFMMIGRRPDIYIRICWCVLGPLIKMAIIIFMAIQYEAPTLFSGAYTFPGWAEGIGFLIVAIVLISIPIGWIMGFVKYGLFKQRSLAGIWKVVKESVQPTSEWKPALAKDQTGRYSPENMRKLEKVQPDDMIYTLPGMDNVGYDNDAFRNDHNVSVNNIDDN